MKAWGWRPGEECIGRMKAWEDEGLGDESLGDEGLEDEGLGDESLGG